MWMPRGGEKGGVRTHRLADEHDWMLKCRGVNHGSDIVGEGIARKIIWDTSAATVAALVDGHRSVTRKEVPHGAEPFSRMPSESVQQDHRPSTTA
jgi:hypothetical protein